MSGFGQDAPVGTSPMDASHFSTRASVGKLELEEPNFFSPRGKPLHSPASLPSTAPSTPALSFSLDGGDAFGGHSSIFFRCVSGASTIEPVMELEHDEAWDDSALPPLPDSRPEMEEALDASLLEVKQLYSLRFGRDIDQEESDDEEEYECDADGTRWIKYVGTGPLTVASLEDSLAEVKQLFNDRFGRNIDREEDDEEEYEYDADGTPWIKHVGTGPLTLTSLEDSLAEAKRLYTSKFGRDIDQESTDDEEEYEYDADGTAWIKHVGTGPLTLASLQDSLAEVKELYSDRFGKDVDQESTDDEEEYEYDADGTAWIKYVGPGPLTLDSLQDSLDEVKQLYSSKFGKDVDEESDDDEYEYDADGTAWIKHVGTGPLTLDSLQDSLDEVKQLYSSKFGRDVDEESDDEEYEYDADGTAWIKHVGTGPLTLASLEDSLAEVKQLFSSKFGRDIDEESDDVEEYEYDADGTPWIKHVGTGPLTLDSLEESLDEVKRLFESKFGRDIDQEESDEEEYEYDADGTAWIKHVGAGPLTLASLEDSLAEVKQLYKSKFGRDVDDDDEEEYEYDADGTAWIKHVGAGPLTIASLEDSLAEVKELYKSKFGRDVDDDEEYEYDADGTAWIKHVGAGPLTFASLEGSLAEVKQLFKSKFGRDADEEDEEEYEYDADGTAWIKHVGTGPLTIASLEDGLAEVKQLFKSKFGRDVEEEDEEEYEYDADGTAWIKHVGTGPLTIASLEDSLAEVKQLFNTKFGQDVDEEESEDDEYEYDADGTRWIKHVGTGPLSLATLEDSLADVKQLYKIKFGRDLDDEASDDEEECERDADGTQWIKYVGTGPVTLASLDEKLAEVKALFESKYARDAEAEYDEDGTEWIKIEGTGVLSVNSLEDQLGEVKRLFEQKFGQDANDELEYDADGTAWVRTVGQGPLTVKVVEDRLAAVKALFRERYGHDVDEESEADEQPEFDEDGTAWVKTVGQGPLTVEVLESKIEELKELYESRFDSSVDDDEDDEEPEEEFDQDGTLWFKWEGKEASNFTA